MRVQDIYKLFTKQLKDWTQVHCDVCGKHYMKHKLHIAMEMEFLAERRKEQSMRAFDWDI